MKVIKATQNALIHDFELLLPREEFNAKIESRLVELSRNADIKGFRKGKVPTTLMRSRYGSQVQDEVIEVLSKESMQNLIQEHNLTPCTWPQFIPRGEKPFEGYDDIIFDVQIESLPQFEMIDFKKLDIEQYIIDKAQHQTRLQEVLDRLAQEQEGTTPAPDNTAAKMGDTVIIDYEGRLNNTPFEGGSAQQTHLKIGAARFLADFEKGAIGIKKGEERDIKVDFPQEYPQEMLAGKSTTFTFTCHDVLHPTPQPIDDSLAKNMGVEDLETIKKLILERIEQDDLDRTRVVAKRVLLDKLDESFQFDIPVSMAKQEFSMIKEQMENARAKAKLDNQTGDEFDQDLLEEEYESLSKRRVKLAIILHRFGQEHNIKAEEQEITNAIIERAQQVPEEMRNRYIQHFSNDKKARIEFENPIIEEKAIDLLLGMVNTKNKTIAIEEFEKLEQALNSSEAESKASKLKAKKTSAKKASAKKTDTKKSSAKKADAKKTPSKK